MKTKFDNWMTTTQLSKMTGLSERYIEERLKDKIEHYHLWGGGRRWNPKSVERFLEMHRVEVK